jgi:linoleoyl-CoA desaturase
MKMIKFQSEDPVQKKFVVELKKQVLNYFKVQDISLKGDYRMILKAIFMLTMYILPFILLLLIPLKPAVAVLLIVVMGIGEAGIGMSVMHDAAHGAFSSKAWVNKLFAATIFLLGSNTLNWKIQHNVLHHTFTNIYGYDQDIETKAALRLSEHAPLKRYHKHQHIYAFLLYGFMTLSKLITDFKQLAEFNKNGITLNQGKNASKEMTKLICSKLIYFVVIIGLSLRVTTFSWYEILLGFCLLHLTAGIIMSTIFQMAHIVEGAQQPLPDSMGRIHHEWEVHQLFATSDFARKNKILGWYAGGLNYQIEHHLFPNICHMHYPKIAPLVEQIAMEHGIRYNLKGSFLEAFISHRKRLKTLGRNP